MDVGVCVGVIVGVGDGDVGDGVVYSGIEVGDVGWMKAYVSALVPFW
jgi:hypothetical protein